MLKVFIVFSCAMICPVFASSQLIQDEQDTTNHHFSIQPGFSYFSPFLKDLDNFPLKNPFLGFHLRANYFYSLLSNNMFSPVIGLGAEYQNLASRSIASNNQFKYKLKASYEAFLFYPTIGIKAKFGDIYSLLLKTRYSFFNISSLNITGSASNSNQQAQITSAIKFERQNVFGIDLENSFQIYKNFGMSFVVTYQNHQTAYSGEIETELNNAVFKNVLAEKKINFHEFSSSLSFSYQI
ncbi:hypothetical protein QEJ31_13610 [Pigmentibacter sp. JX0631]|uniref:hypothetical protein n=1 Tax=Pigmentibacter sp. JX0631 TaxID=2976982 RepID=UPI0024685E78|nr:hypothetical protein [Pigmentibacter sp. JX0631]WGL59562.1 hypothetical protein QEJ31_13610 [Pigmentibacter sp. JX0631]